MLPAINLELVAALFTEETSNLIFEKMLLAVQHMGGDIDGFVYCPHHPDDGCDCRKPKPGLFLQLAEQHGADLSKAIAIGDSLRDLQAAQACSVTCALVRTGNGDKTLLSKDSCLESVPIYNNLAHAVLAFGRG